MFILKNYFWAVNSKDSSLSDALLSTNDSHAGYSHNLLGYQKCAHLHTNFGLYYVLQRYVLLKLPRL